MRDAAIYTQKIDGATLAILWGGLQTASPNKWMDLMANKYYGHNPYTKYIEVSPCPGLYISPVLILSEINSLPFVPYYKSKLPLTKIYRHPLTINGDNGKRIGEVVIIWEQDITLTYRQVNDNISAIQNSITKKTAYNVFNDEHKDNPYIRIIISGIEKLPFCKFEAQRIPSFCDLGQFSHEIYDEEVSSMAYITRDWLSYMTSVTKAKKQVNEDTLRYLLCDYWERRISGTFATEEHYKRFVKKEMDIKWKNKGIDYFVEIKYVSSNTDTTGELQRIFNDIYRLSLEKEYIRNQYKKKKVRCLFIIFGAAHLFEKHLKRYSMIYTGLHPNYMYNRAKSRSHILSECLSFYKDEPHKQIIDTPITNPYYTRFNSKYGQRLEYKEFATDLIELALADNVFDTKQQCVAIWEVDRDNE